MPNETLSPGSTKLYQGNLICESFGSPSQTSCGRVIPKISKILAKKILLNLQC